MRATIVSRMRATCRLLDKGYKDVYRLDPLGPKPKRVLGVVYNSQARHAPHTPAPPRTPAQNAASLTPRLAGADCGLLRPAVHGAAALHAPVHERPGLPRSGRAAQHARRPGTSEHRPRTALALHQRPPPSSHHQRPTAFGPPPSALRTRRRALRWRPSPSPSPRPWPQPRP